MKRKAPRSVLKFGSVREQELVHGKDFTNNWLKAEKEVAHCCPNCGNEEFYTEYEAKWKAVGSWVIQAKN